jgi:SSS family solute:Na+ symporter
MLSTIDVTVVVVYALALFGIAQWVSREQEGHQKTARDYFLAGSSLPWWAIGASLIAANISAEQIIGMSGSGFAIGLGIASYEWMAAITLILVGKYLLPIFLKRGIYTMPQFLEQRYDHIVRIVMAFFWLAVYVFVNLTSILWLGALAIQTVAGLDLLYGLVFLGLFAVRRSEGRSVYRHHSGRTAGSGRSADCLDHSRQGFGRRRRAGWFRCTGGQSAPKIRHDPQPR